WDGIAARERAGRVRRGPRLYDQERRDHAVSRVRRPRRGHPAVAPGGRGHERRGPPLEAVGGPLVEGLVGPGRPGNSGAQPHLLTGIVMKLTLLPEGAGRMLRR